MLRDLLKTFSQTNSCESWEKMSETYYRWVDINIFINEKPIKILTFIYAFNSQKIRDIGILFTNGCESCERMSETYNITGGLMSKYSYMLNMLK